MKGIYVHLVGIVRQSIWVKLAIICIVAALVTFGTKLTYSAIVLRQNVALIEELSRRTLQRAELAADYAVITLSELASDGLGRCDSDSLMEIRRIIYLRGAVKDVQVLGENGVLRCAGLPQARELNVANFELDGGYPASNGSIHLHDIGLEDSGLLGIVWRFGPKLTFLAVLNVDSLLFDVFPAALRDGARADLILGADMAFATYAPFSESEMPIIKPMLFSASSDRYPLRIKFKLSEDALQGWNRGAEPYFVMFGAVLGLIIGVMSAALMTRKPEPSKVMRAALHAGEFIPYMQPLFNIEDRRIIGCEVLTRWVKPDGTIIPPYRFIPLAEESGLILPMTRDIIVSSLAVLRDLLRSDKTFKVAFNIVPADLVSVSFAKDICAIVKDSGVARRQIVLEITERQELANLELAVAAIAELRALGFRVALDDTGTGHNGLTNVQALGADIIKIDKHFIDRVCNDRAASTIIQMLVKIADELDMTTVAEGIETVEQLDKLHECRVDEGQGFLISPPLSAPRFLELVADQSAANADSKAA